MMIQFLFSQINSKRAKGSSYLLRKFHNHSTSKFIRNNFMGHQDRYEEGTSGGIYESLLGGRASPCLPELHQLPPSQPSQITCQVSLQNKSPRPPHRFPLLSLFYIQISSACHWKEPKMSIKFFLKKKFFFIFLYFVCLHLNIFILSITVLKATVNLHIWWLSKEDQKNSLLRLKKKEYVASNIA